MKIRINPKLISPLLFSFLALSTPLFAQQYITIDHNLGLYCAVYPDNSLALAGLNTSNGNLVVSLLDADEKILDLDSKIKGLKKRQQKLRKVIHANSPSKISSDVKFLIKVVLKVVKNKDIKLSDRVVVKESRKLIKKYDAQIDNFRSVREKVAMCRDQEEPPSPSSATVKIVDFVFTHPDQGIDYYLAGLALVATVDPKVIRGSMCVTVTERANGDIGKLFPYEDYIQLVRNPCLYFYGTAFQNYPLCTGELVDGNPNTVVAWFDVVISSAPISQTYFDKWESMKERIEPISARPRTKRSPCLGES
ncbi:MAG: hypothetical protein KDD64_01815 [Bdellovibrionales bacterium]|nr:hypothetical protein [Bdellovibrionales bacterium]